MKTAPCPHGESAVQAARTGKWSDELAAHVAKCISCRESSRVARWMTELAETVPAGSPPFPDPQLIWLKAQIRRRSKGLERVLLPIKIGSVLTAIGLGVILTSLPREVWSSVYEWLTSASTLVSELLNLMPLSPLTTLWVPAGILVILLLLFIASEA